mgnify:CR=1 FL=1
MNVHIIRDPDVSEELYQEVFGHLNESRGPLSFIVHENIILAKELKTKAHNKA